MNPVNYVYSTVSDRSIIDNILLKEMCKVIISLLCTHALVYVIHRISDQIDVTELNIIFYIFFNIILNFPYFI